MKIASVAFKPLFCCFEFPSNKKSPFFLETSSAYPFFPRFPQEGTLFFPELVSRAMRQGSPFFLGTPSAALRRWRSFLLEFPLGKVRLSLEFPPQH